MKKSKAKQRRGVRSVIKNRRAWVIATGLGLIGATGAAVAMVVRARRSPDREGK